jgi:hypothetical protein
MAWGSVSRKRKGWNPTLSTNEQIDRGRALPVQRQRQQIMAKQL